MGKTKGKIVAVAGHFNPLHAGHLKMIKQAKKLGDYLIVIVSNDIQVKKKTGKIFIPEEDRMTIMQSIKEVDAVVLSIDTDSNVCKTLEVVKPDIFASGCDNKHPDAIKEIEVCKKLGINPIFNVGGKKIRASSDILSTYKDVVWHTQPNAILQVGEHRPKKDKIYKLHYHKNIMEFMILTKGKMTVKLTDNKWKTIKNRQMKVGDFIVIEPKTGHEITLKAGSVMVEVKEGPYKDDKVYATA